MSLVVQKFGGTSVADIDRLRSVARIIEETRDQGHHVIAVVSAMAGVTDQLVHFIQKARPTARDDASLMEHDTVLAAGEQVTSGLLALCLQERGIPARSFLSFQIPLETDDHFTNAKAINVHTQPLREFLNDGGVPVIAGFQGIHKGRVTTLGRGGSDATAVLVASALRADWCDIYTDVTGVFTSDPRVIPSAQKLSHVSFEDMLELSAQGAKVLQEKSVRLAHEKGVRLRILSTFEKGSGTEVSPHVKADEKGTLTGIAHHFLDAWIKLRIGGDTAYSAQKLKDLLHINRFITSDFTTRILSHTQSEIHFAIKRADLVPITHMLRHCQGEIAFFDMKSLYTMAHITLVGSAISHRPGFVTHVLAFLKKMNIFPEVLVIGKRKLSFMVEESLATTALKALHEEFVEEDVYGANVRLSTS